MQKDYNIYVEDIKKRKANDLARICEDGREGNTEETRERLFCPDRKHGREEKIGLTKLIFIGGQLAKCDDCGKAILDGNQEDEINFFNHDRCASCTEKMFKYMEEYA